MREVVLVAIAAAIGNLLQGWDNSTIAGAIIYIKKEFNLESEPIIEGLILAMSIIGGTVVTTFSGPASDRVGRRPMLIISSALYFTGGMVMLWAPNIHVLLLARLLAGFGVGLVVTLASVYISEIAPSEIRGQLTTLTQFAGSVGMFLSYCMVFGMSLMDSLSWRLMLGILSILSLIYFTLTAFYLPESPRWLVSKGRLIEAEQVLQRLRGRKDVTDELALLVEGLGVGAEASIEEYLIGPDNEPTDNQETSSRKYHIKLYGARPVSGQVHSGIESRNTSLASHSLPLVDPLVSLFGSVHERLPETGSMFNGKEDRGKNEQWDMESQTNGEGFTPNVAEGNYHEDLSTPLLSRQTSSMDKDIAPYGLNGSHLGTRQNSNNAGEAATHADIGGGWQLVWKWYEKIGEDGKKEEGFERIYLHQEGGLGSRHGSLVLVSNNAMPVEGEYLEAVGLISQQTLSSKALLSRNSIGLVMDHQAETVSKRSSWSYLLEPGVKRALFVGIALQVLQQISGINGLLYYSPQILEKAGVAILLSNFGISSASASLLISALTTFLMLPCIALAMGLMDIAGRRSLLLYTIPILIVSLIAIVFSSMVDMGSVINATLSTTGLVVYSSVFVMAFGVIPNILCSEIFPTRVRGLCIAICALTYWIGNIIVTYSTPLLLSSIGLAGVFSIFVIGCIISWIFVYMKVPETKGMPLEVICEFFAAGTNQAAVANGN